MNDKLTPQKPHKSLSVRKRLNSERLGITSSQNISKTCNIKPFNSTPLLTKQAEFYFKNSKLTASPINNSSIGIKPWEQLHQQNSALKLKINSLNNVLGKQKIKQQIGSKNYKKINDKLNIQFSEQVYFESMPHGNYLVEGIKCQYYKMKQKYQDKCHQYNQLFKQSNISSYQQLKIYCKELETDNKKLKQRVAKVLRIQDQLFLQMQVQQCVQIAEDGGIQATRQWIEQQQKYVADLLGVSSKIAILQDEAQKVTQRIVGLDQKIEIQKRIMKERKQKIIYLQRINKKKCNQIVQLQQQLRRQRKGHKEQIQQLKLQIKKQEELHQVTIQKLLTKQKKRFQAQKQIFNQYFKERQLQVQSLKREIKSKRLLLGSKQAITALRTKKQRKKTNYQSQNKFKLTFAKEPTFIQSSHSQNQQLNKKEENQQHNAQKQLQKRSYIKHNELCIKIHPVKQQQIQHLKKQLKYRFIYHRLLISQVKQCLNSGQQDTQNQQRLEVITFKQIKEKLTKFPFCLNDQNAHLLARYIVEDCSKSILYFHEENQIERAVAKSIIRAFVGEYSLPNQQISKGEIKQILSKKGKNLLSALYFLAPQGFITSQRLAQICNNLQVKFNEETWNYLMSHLFMSSKQKIEELDYSNIFTHFQ